MTVGPGRGRNCCLRDDGTDQNKPIQLDDGRILCPSSSEHQGWRVHVEITSDLKDWRMVGPLNDGKEYGVIQPTILTYPDGRLQMLCRTRGKAYVTQSWSTDGGSTWSPFSVTSLPNPNSGIDGVTLKDGRQLLVFNNTPKGRSPLNVAVSSDGQNWDVVLTLEDQPGEYSIRPSFRPPMNSYDIHVPSQEHQTRRHRSGQALIPAQGRDLRGIRGNCTNPTRMVGV